MSGAPGGPSSKPNQHIQHNHQDPASLRLLKSLQANTTPSNPDPASAQEIYTTQIAHRTLFLRGTSPDPNSQDARSARRKKRLAAQTHASARQRPRKLSAREKRTLRVYHVELVPGTRRTSAEWSVWKGLWRMWCGYAWEVFGLEPLGMAALKMSPVTAGPKVASLELHGAVLRVVKAGCASVVGLWGVCVRETMFGVLLVDERCYVRRVGKKDTVFRVEVPLPLAGGVQMGEKMDATREDAGGGDGKGLDLDVFRQEQDGRVTFEISGNALLCRPADRATRKFRGRKYDGL